MIDDSYITFRFVDMFTKGHGWRFSPEGPRVEGFTNFLWAILLIPPHLLGWDLMFMSKLMGVLSGIATMFAAWRLCRWVRDRDDLLNLICPAILATNVHFAHWAMMGLETLMQCAFVTAAYWRFIKEQRESRLLPLSAVLCLLAAMTRFDSLYYLSPLGLYGVWALVRGHSTIRRALLWAGVAAIPFCVYTGWKAAYFGSLLPNTYWAKQRHVIFDGHDRGVEQLHHYYLAQSDGQRVDPPAGGPQRFWRAVHVGLAGPLHSFAWMNLWLIGVTGCGLWAFLGTRHCRAATLLILLPWLLNIYYVYHVNGDWMPGYRFFQVGLPFIAVAFVVGLGRLPELFAGRARRILRWGMLPVGLWLTAAVALEQLQINTVYVFGRDSFIYIARDSGWWTPSRLSSLWNRGFAPPLREVSEELLLNTQDGAWVFMSDIGQPLWFSEHLNLYDVDGLVDPRLGHSPVGRGDLPTVKEIEARLLAERGDDPIDRAGRKAIHEQALRQDFEAQVQDNARWIMEERKPEYLLIFVNHVESSPTSPGSAYPWVSYEVFRHAAMAEYEDIWHSVKTGYAFNHLYRRRDVPAEISPRVRFQRLLRAVERNPRMPALGVVLAREARKVPDLTPDEEKQVGSILARMIRQFPADSAVGEIAAWATISGSTTMATMAYDAMVDVDPSNVEAWRILAQSHLRNSDTKSAIKVLERAVPFAPTANNDLHYQLAWCFEQEGRIDDGVAILRSAIDRRMDDARAWSDLASLLSRAGMNGNLPADQRRDWLKQSRTAFERYRELLGENGDRIQADLDRIDTELSNLGGQAQ